MASNMMLRTLAASSSRTLVPRSAAVVARHHRHYTDNAVAPSSTEEVKEEVKLEVRSSARGLRHL